jgi:hypothetical protein
MTNTHIDKEAREAILFLANYVDSVAQERVRSISGDQRLGAFTPLLKIQELLTPLPAEGESSPKPEAGEPREDWLVEVLAAAHNVDGSTFTYNFEDRVVNIVERDDLLRLRVAVGRIPTTWFDDVAARRGWKKNPLGGWDSPVDSSKDQLLHPVTGPRPHPQPAEPKVMPWPEDLTTLIGKRITLRAKDGSYKETIVVKRIDNYYIYAECRYSRGFTTINNVLLSVEEVHPPQPSEQAKGAEWLPEGMPSLAAEGNDSGIGWVRGRDTQWRTFIESERAQHKAEMEAVKKDRDDFRQQLNYAVDTYAAWLRRAEAAEKKLESSKGASR